MLNKLVDYIKNNHPDTDVNVYLDAKYIQLNNAQLKQIADALERGDISSLPASSCSANHFIFHFGSTFILVQKKIRLIQTQYLLLN